MLERERERDVWCVRECGFVIARVWLREAPKRASARLLSVTVSCIIESDFRVASYVAPQAKMMM